MNEIVYHGIIDIIFSYIIVHIKSDWLNRIDQNQYTPTYDENTPLHIIKLGMVNIV